MSSTPSPCSNDQVSVSPFRGVQIGLLFDDHHRCRLLQDQKLRTGCIGPDQMRGHARRTSLFIELGKNILKEINRYWKIVVYANLACCYHYTRKLSKCNKFCEKIKEELERVLAEPPEKELFLKLSRILIKLKFQHCAILSQLEQH